MSSPIDPAVRSRLRDAAREIARIRDQEEECPPSGDRLLPPLDPRRTALFRLLLDTVALFNSYGIEADPPSEIQPSFRFLRGDLGIQIPIPATLRQPLTLKGLLRETPSSGGPVRAIELSLCSIEWDPALGWVPAAEKGSALDVLIVGILRALRLASSVA